MQLQCVLFVSLVLNVFCLTIQNIRSDQLEVNGASENNNPPYLDINLSLVESLKNNTSSFVDMFTNADPDQINQVIDLLEALSTESLSAHETLLAAKDDADNNLAEQGPVLENEYDVFQDVIQQLQSLIEVKARHWVVVGKQAFEKPNQEDSKVPECLGSTAVTSVGQNAYGNKLGVQCCSPDGQSGSRPDCKSEMSWADAKSHCEQSELRLCTKEEVQGHVGQGSGCSFDWYLVWTSTECTTG